MQEQIEYKNKGTTELKREKKKNRKREREKKRERDRKNPIHQKPYVTANTTPHTPKKITLGNDSFVKIRNKNLETKKYKKQK